MQKKWQVAEKFNDEFRGKFPETNPVILQLLFNRGLDTQDKVDRFLGPDYLGDQNDPYLLQDMKKAVERIWQAVKKGEKVYIYGDYDADGVTSSALVHIVFKYIGIEDLHTYIPNRLEEGYGMNEAAIDYIIEQGANLVVSVDCGIANKKEVEKLQASGIDVIVTDHHMEPSELPKCFAIICPTLAREKKYPFRSLAGVGVAFKLAQGLFRFDKSKNHEAFEKWLLDLLAIGTIADCMPLLGENRTLVKWGLLVLNKTRREGIRELIESASIKYPLGTYSVAFQIAPRINAAGRMDHANTAYELLITEDEAEAIAIANELNQKNQERQKATEEMMKISLEQIGEPTNEQKILFSAYDGWSQGLVGLAAGRLSDKFNRPAIVCGQTGDEYICSGRSIKEFNIVHALDAAREYLFEYGGHAQACGLSIKGQENYEKFIEKIYDYAAEKLAGAELVPTVEIEMETKLRAMDWEVIDELDKFVPFGEGNPEPVFATMALRIENITSMGANGQHARLDLTEAGSGKQYKFIAFGWMERLREYKVGDKIDVAYEFGVNEWGGNRELQFKVKDLKVNNQDTRNKIQKNHKPQISNSQNSA